MKTFQGIKINEELIGMRFVCDSGDTWTITDLDGTDAPIGARRNEVDDPNWWWTDQRREELGRKDDYPFVHWVEGAPETPEPPLQRIRVSVTVPRNEDHSYSVSSIQEALRVGELIGCKTFHLLENKNSLNINFS